MGDPKKPRKKYKTPRFPWRKDVLEAELRIIGQYGLRNKRELWRYQTMVSRFRRIARGLLGKSPEQRAALEKELLGKLHRLGLVSEDATIDDVLDLNVEDILERRLQTIVYKLGLAKTLHQARQLIVHGHIAVGDRRVKVPSYLVKRGEEQLIGYSFSSPLRDPNHSLRKELATPPPVEEGVGEEATA